MLDACEKSRSVFGGYLGQLSDDEREDIYGQMYLKAYDIVDVAIKLAEKVG